MLSQWIILRVRVIWGRLSFQSADRVHESGQLILHEYLHDRAAAHSHITFCVYFCAPTVLNVHNRRNQQEFQALPRVAQQPSEEAQLTKIKKMSEEVKRKIIKVIRLSDKSIRGTLLRVLKIQNVCLWEFSTRWSMIFRAWWIQTQINHYYFARVWVDIFYALSGTSEFVQTRNEPILVASTSIFSFSPVLFL